MSAIKKKQTKKIQKLIKRPFAKEDLLGFGTKTFELNQSEYVAKKMIDTILYKVFDCVRKLNIVRMEGEYSSYKFFNDLTKLVNLGLIKSDEENTVIKYEFNFDIKPPAFETWSNHVKISYTPHLEEYNVEPPKEEEKKSLKEKGKKEGSMIRDRKNSSLIQRAKVGKKEDIQPKKKNAQQDNNLQDLVDLEQSVRVEVDEVEEMKINGYRTYFQEKEIERQKRKQLEKEQEERQKEEEKKVKSLMQVIKSSSLLSYDMDGRYLQVKYIPVNDLKKTTEPKISIKQKKINKDYDNLIKSPAQMSEIEKEEEVKEEKPPKYYQNDPVKTFTMSKGVTLTSNGNKLSGGAFNKGDGRLTVEDFKAIMDKINPYENQPTLGLGLLSKKIKSVGKKKIEKIQEKEQELEATEIPKESKVSKGPSKIYYLFRDDIVGQNELDEDELKKSKQQNILRLNKGKKERKHIVDESKKSEIEKIKPRYKDFNIEDIEENDIEDLKEYFKHEERDLVNDYYQPEKIAKPKIIKGKENNVRDRFSKSKVGATKKIAKVSENKVEKKVEKKVSKSTNFNKNNNNKDVLPKIDNIN